MLKELSDMKAQHLTTMGAVGMILLGGAAGQTSTISIPFMGFDFDTVDASVVAVQEGRTTLALNCPPGSGSSSCGVYATETVVTGPSTYSLVLTDPAALSFTQACIPSGTSPFSTYSCHESAEGTKVQDGPSSSTTVHTDDVTYTPVTITAGVELLNGATPAATTSPSAATTSASSDTCSTSGQITECSGIDTSAGPTASSDSSMSPVSTAAETSATTGSSNEAAANDFLDMKKVLGLLAFPWFLI